MPTGTSMLCHEDVRAQSRSFMSFMFLFSQKDFLCLQGEFTCMCARYRHGMWNCEFRNFSNALLAVWRFVCKMCLIQNVHEFTRHESSATEDPSNLKVNIFCLVSVFRSPVAKKQHAKWFYLRGHGTISPATCPTISFAISLVSAFLVFSKAWSPS